MEHLTVQLPEQGAVSALLHRPDPARALLVLAHGAGAGMEHPFMEAVADTLAEREIATLRYQFPYMEAGKKRPDRAPVAQATVRAAVARGVEEAAGLGAPGRSNDRESVESGQPRLPVFAGGKSFGGRMTSRAAAEEPLPGVRGLVFLGFPLHAPGRPGTDRAAHLQDVDVPMLFVQGTRDALARLELLEPVVREIDSAQLHVVQGGDHSFKVLKRSGRMPDEVMAEIGDAVAGFVTRPG